MSELANPIPRPGLALGRYPERHTGDTNPMDIFCSRMADRLLARWKWRVGRIDEIVAAVNEFGDSFAALTETEKRQKLSEVRSRLVYSDTDESAAIQAFAIVREMSDRILGVRHYESQILGGWAMYQGKLAEMQTGEGKTLAAVLPAATAALAGIPVHVITANDYLASRDAATMRPLYKALGLSVGVISESLSFQARQAAYACDVTYCTNKQVCFDYLRDRVARGNEVGKLKLNLEQLYDEPGRANNLLLRGLCFAIVDEADSVLIDDARTPLVLSQELSGDESSDLIYEEALYLANKLTNGIDFGVDSANRQIQLAKRCMQCVAMHSSSLSGVWDAPRQAESLLRDALTAQHLFVRDRDYIVENNEVKIVDQNTGRVMEGHSWDYGIQQMIEAKEQCKLSGRKCTLARISYQRFFRRYIRLSGMTGTASEVKRELNNVYGLGVVRIAPHRTCRRVAMASRAFVSVDYSQAAIAQSALQHSSSGRPVLIGTRSVAVSKQIAKLLTLQGIDVQVLNACQDEHEAEVIASAGHAGRVTVATNMAGRGTDILLGPGVEEKGGLHVILSESNDSTRVNRQLIGRCARHGERGSFECFYSLDDELIRNTYSAKVLCKIAPVFNLEPGRLPTWLANIVINLRLHRVEIRHERVRSMIEREDERLDRLMSFAGVSE